MNSYRAAYRILYKYLGQWLFSGVLLGGYVFFALMFFKSFPVFLIEENGAVDNGLDRAVTFINFLCGGVMFAVISVLPSMKKLIKDFTSKRSLEGQDTFDAAISAFCIAFSAILTFFLAMLGYLFIDPYVLAFAEFFIESS